MPDVMVLYNVVMVWIYLCPNNGVVHCRRKSAMHIYNVNAYELAWWVCSTAAGNLASKCGWVKMVGSVNPSATP